jgi:hypothetical protein
MNYNMNIIFLISLILFIVFTNCGVLYIIDQRLRNLQINVPKQNINLKIDKSGFTPKTKPMNFDNRPLINPVSEHEIPKKQPIRYTINSNDIPKCSS